MRISDWSSDVCSSDLAYIFPGGCLISESRFRALAEARGLAWRDVRHFGGDYAETLRQWRERFDAAVAAEGLPAGFDERFIRLWRYYLQYCEGGFRSEEHTSELQSLMRISYAVFCLKKKKPIN